MHINLIETWQAMNTLVRGVVIALTIQAVLCLTVTVDRFILLISSYRRGRKFAKQAGPLLARADYQGALDVARKHEASHLAGFIRVGVETFLDKRRKGLCQDKAAALAARALERKSENLTESLHRGMNILASTGSTAPFIGLLGTVLGILNAFKLVSQQGSGGMGTIGVAIAEALIVTGFGLMVAIPAVLLFNTLSARIAKYEAGLAHARSELVDHLAGAVDEAESEEAPRSSSLPHGAPLRASASPA